MVPDRLVEELGRVHYDCLVEEYIMTALLKE
jgi:hypothetical protein